MEMRNFIEKFAEELEIEDVDSLNEDTYFRELEEWTSLAALTIMGMIDDNYEVALNATEMRTAETLGELFDLVKSKL